MGKVLINVIRRRIKSLFNFLGNDKIKLSILEAVPFWIAASVTGLVAVGYTKLFDLCEGILHDALSWQRWLIFILAPLNFVIAWYVVKLFAYNARGSGIPQGYVSDIKKEVEN